MSLVLNLLGVLIIIGAAVFFGSVALQAGGNVVVGGILGLIIGFMFMVITCGVAFLFLEMNNNLIRIKEILEHGSGAARMGAFYQPHSVTDIASRSQDNSRPGTHHGEPESEAADIMTVRVQAGRVQEYVNGSLRRSYGSDIVDVATDGELVAAVTRQGRIEEFSNGSLRRTYGSDVVRVRVTGGSVFADLKNGRTAAYVNGILRRTF